MALVSIDHGLIWPFGKIPVNSQATGALLDAAGEKQCAIGKIYIEGKASSKTLDTSGSSKIIFAVSNAPVFDNAASEFRVGFQGLDKTAMPVRSNGTWSVYAAITTASDATPTLTTTSNFHEKVPTSGTVTLSHGDEVCFVLEMTARGGSDAITPISNYNQIYPCGSAYTAAAWAASAIPVFYIVFSDGTLGWLDFHDPFMNCRNDTTVLTWADASNPDEYGEIFQVPFACKVDALWSTLRLVDANSDYTIILYSAPTGTPVAEVTVTVTAENLSLAASESINFWTIPEFTLSANTDYCVAVKATGTSNLRFLRNYIYSAGLRKVLGNGGTTLNGATRNNSTGAFSTSTTTHYPCGVRISQLQDGTGGSGTTIAGTPMLRGMV